jgi:amino acid transporter
MQKVPASRRKLTILSLAAATYFMVSGGPYGMEELVRDTGYKLAIVILFITPLIWSLPTGLMVGELAAALPAEGGFYVWVRRAMGPFWGFQEAWLSLIASIFDMAIYPTLFVAYLTRLIPSLSVGHRGTMVGLAMVAVCTALNLAGIHLVGLTSLWLFFLLSAPFALIILLGPFHIGMLAHAQTGPVTSTVGLLGGTLIAMWNYMGWDNASTIAQEVERPQHTYPRAMIATVALVAASYLLPVLAVWITGLPSTAFENGAWADIAGLLAGNWLRVALVLGGMMSAFGMFNALVMSYSRLPLAMAQDGMLPRGFARVQSVTRVPWVSVLVCSAGWALCVGLGFERLITLDVMFYGASLALEFVTLVALRMREPNLERPFRIPGGIWGAVIVGVEPLLLMIVSVLRSQRETVFGMNGVLFGVVVVAIGFALFFATAPLRGRVSA